jgi:hypothetical protein
MLSGAPHRIARLVVQPKKLINQQYAKAGQDFLMIVIKGDCSPVLSLGF